MVRILTEPKNAIVKQYKKLLEMDNIKLEFEEDAIKSVARKAIELKTGARGLRTILEEHMLNIMYNAPQDKSIKEIVITPSVITENKEQGRRNRVGCNLICKSLTTKKHFVNRDKFCSNRQGVLFFLYVKI